MREITLQIWDRKNRQLYKNVKSIDLADKAFLVDKPGFSTIGDSLWIPFEDATVVELAIIEDDSVTMSTGVIPEFDRAIADLDKTLAKTEPQSAK